MEGAARLVALLFRIMIKRIWQKMRSLNMRDLLSRDDGNLAEELEERFIMADFGVDTTLRIVEKLSSRAKGGGEEVRKIVLDEIVSILGSHRFDSSLHDPSTSGDPSVVLLVGVNGTGKTTTCARLARKFMMDGFDVLLVAADTFRAGASEQLTKWSERLGCEILKQKKGADPASVLYDGIEMAKNRGYDVVICDTAGRLHTEGMLMEELKKIKRVSSKLVEEAPHEILLVLDATTGQNAIRQARTFHDELGLTGVVLCKMDGTSKGGIVVSIVDQLGIPVKYLGVGEGLDDLVPFDPEAFSSRLLGLEETVPPDSVDSLKGKPSS
jgi:fused signal recognition particle receptor